MSLIFQEHKDLIRNVAENNGFKEYELEIQSGTEKGDGYVGDLIKITIKNENKQLPVVLKLPPTVDDSQAATPVRDVFLKEVHIYENLLPEMKKFQEDNGLLHGFEGYAKCYGTCNVKNKEAIVMEDLTKNGYSLWNRRIPMDHNHMSAVMTEYGKLHAVSFAMKKKNPEKFQELKAIFEITEEKEDFEREEMKVIVNVTVNKYGKAIEGNDKLEKALKKLIEETDTFIADFGSHENQLVFDHGDSWCNNIFFRYENSQDSSPTKVCLIDWQETHLRTPIFDVAFFFFHCCHKDTYYKYKTYLKIYHNSLSQSLRSMSCDPEELYPYSLFEEHWRKYAKVALFIAPTVFPILTIDKNEVPDKDSINSLEAFYDQLSHSGANEELVNQKLRDLMIFLVTNDFV